MFPDESSVYADAVFRGLKRAGRALAPAIWPLEIANSLWAAERRGRVSAAEVERRIIALSLLRVEVAHQLPVWAYSHALPLARRLGLSVYDAAYLRLAVEEGLPIASVDRGLRQASASMGVPHFQP